MIPRALNTMGANHEATPLPAWRAQTVVVRTAEDMPDEESSLIHG